MTYKAKLFNNYLVTSDIDGKICIYDTVNFNLVCKTENYKPIEDGDEMKVIKYIIVCGVSNW